MQGDLLLQTTFQQPRELKRACEAFARLRLPYERIEPTAALARVVLPALVMTRDAREQLDSALPDQTVAGWVAHRPAVAELPLGPAPIGEEAPFGRAAIVVLTPCVADDTKIPIIAHITGALEPSFETRKRPPALEVFKRLPGTNCGLCEEITCMAFALRLWAGEVGVRQCTPVFLPEHEARRAALLEICSGLGISNDGPDEEDER